MDNAMRAIIEAAREYGFFVDRGDPVNWDWTSVDFTRDTAWHEKDISAIVPEHAHGVLMLIAVQSALVGQSIRFRKTGNVNIRNRTFTVTQAANIINFSDVCCPISTDRKIDYLTNNDPWTTLSVIIKGWWF